MPPASPRIRFLFDYISSNAYLAWLELPKLAAKFGAEVEAVPVLFAGLLEAHGQLGPAEVRAKARWMWKNNLRKARRLGVTIRPPAFHPFNPLLSLRVSSLPMPDAARTALIGGLFRAVWTDSLHVSEPEVVAKIANDAGLDGRRLVEAARAPESKARLREVTDRAIAEGVFGVPTMIVGDELFWGYDDVPFLEQYLAGADPIGPDDVPTGPRRASAARRRFRDTS